MANLTKCLVCGNEYTYCPSCIGTHAWKFYTDTHEHYQIYMIINQYDSKLMSKEEAKDALERLGITKTSKLDNLKPTIAEHIRSIIDSGEKAAIKKTKKSQLYKE